MSLLLGSYAGLILRLFLLFSNSLNKQKQEIKNKSLKQHIRLYINK